MTHAEHARAAADAYATADEMFERRHGEEDKIKIAMSEANYHATMAVYKALVDPGQRLR